MIDARGYACPMPVAMVQKAVKNGAPEELEVLVDNRCAVENISRFAGNHGYRVQVTEQGGEAFTLRLHR